MANEMWKVIFSDNGNSTVREEAFYSFNSAYLYANELEENGNLSESATVTIETV